MLKRQPEEILVIEDTDLGIEAAISAGIEHVYGWPHQYSPGQSYSKAKGVISELNDVDFIASLFR